MSAPLGFLVIFNVIKRILTSDLQKPLNIEIITPAMFYSTLIGGLPFVGPAFDTALRDIRQDYPALNISQTLIYDRRFRSCIDWAMESDNTVAKYFYSTKRRDAMPDVTAFILAGCNDVNSLGPLATQWNTFILTSVASASVLRQKKISPTWVTTTANSPMSYARVYTNLARQFNWTSFGIITDLGGNPFFPEMAKSVRKELSGLPNIQLEYLTVNSAANTIEAESLNMTNGEYVYVAMTPFRSSALGNFTWNFNDSLDEVAKKAFGSLLIVEPDESVYGMTKDSVGLAAEWKQRSQIDYNYTYGPTENFSPHPAATYSALIMFAQVMTELYVSNATWNRSDGNLIARKFFNRTFHLKTGNVIIDEVGERIPLIVIGRTQENSSSTESVMIQYPGRATLTIIKDFNWPGKWPPPNQPRCGFRGNDVSCILFAGSSATITGAATGTVVALLLTICFAALFIRKGFEEFAIHRSWWKLDPGFLELAPRNRTLSLVTKRNQSVGDSMTLRKNDPLATASYRLRAVWLTQIGTGKMAETVFPQRMPRSKLLFLKELHGLTHGNINAFLGFCFRVEKSSWYLVSNLCTRGSLSDVLEVLRLDFDLQISFIVDLLQGTVCIHQSSIKVHGNLSSWNCLIDSHFTLKLGHLGYSQLKEVLVKEAPLTSLHSTKQFYVAPEILRNEHSPTASSDIYSVGMIIHHILTMSEPFCNAPSVADEVDAIRKGGVAPVRPVTSYPDIFNKMIPIVLACWEENPTTRPSSKFLSLECQKVLGVDKNSRSRLNVVERTLDRLERYSNELDDQVFQRTVALVEERRKCDTLLQEMLPRLIIENLRAGIVTDPEVFQLVTIMFTEIAGFQQLLVSLESVDVFAFLNGVYSVFDNLVQQYDVYKVETIKDSYMVTSGLPVRNGNNHVREIGNLALNFMLKYGVISTLSTALRIGIHTGPCVAGVVGLKTPRYCLFGDTVNTASRMLMHGSDSMIHLSDTASSLLSTFPEFNLVQRGPVEVKGKGLMLTSWLRSSKI